MSGPNVTPAGTDQFSALQDLVRIQSDQLVLVQRQIEELVVRNNLIWLGIEELSRQSEELPPPEEQTYAAEEDVSSNTVNPLVCAAIRKIDPGLMDPSPQIIDDNATEGYDGPVPGSDSTRPFSPPIDNLVPFCRKGSPWDFIKRAKKAPKHDAIFAVLGNELIFENGSRNTGTLIKPQHNFKKTPSGTLKQGPYANSKWTKRAASGQKYNVVWQRSADWYYLGTYEMSQLETMEAAEFMGLPIRCRREICLITADHSKQVSAEMDIAARYASGELKADKIVCRRVGFNEELHNLLFESTSPRPQSAMGQQRALSKVDTNEATTSGGGSVREWSIGVTRAAECSAVEMLAAERSGGNAWRRVGAPAVPPSSAVGSSWATTTNWTAKSPIITTARVEGHRSSPSARTEIQRPREYGTSKKALKERIKAAKAKETDSWPEIAYFGDELVMDVEDIRRVFAVCPLSKFGPKRMGYTQHNSIPVPFKPGKTYELIAKHSGIYLHLGSYECTTCMTMTPEEFGGLSATTKEKVYEMTAGGGEKKLKQINEITNIGTQYEGGGLEGCRIDFLRVGISRDMERCLLATV